MNAKTIYRAALAVIYFYVDYVLGLPSGTSTDSVLSIGFHRNPSTEAQRPTLGKRHWWGNFLGAVYTTPFKIKRKTVYAF